MLALDHQFILLRKAFSLVACSKTRCITVLHSTVCTALQSCKASLHEADKEGE